MQYVCGRMSRAALYKEPGLRPAAPPCFCRWQRSSLLRRGFFTRRTVRRVDAVRIHPPYEFSPVTKQKPQRIVYVEAFWWSEATQIRTIALWGIFGGDLIKSDGFCAVFVVECNQNFFIIEINSIHECIDKRFTVAFHVRVELAEPGQPEPNLIFA